VARGWLGIEGDSLVAARAKELGVSGGAVVKKVKAASPAETAGLATSDVITAIDGAAVASMQALVIKLRDHKPGEAVTLSVVRGTEKRTMKVTLAERPTT
jgi:S1-C subfamily serine protease